MANRLIGPKTRDEAVKLYESGLTSETVAKKLRVSQQSVRGWVRAAGGTLRRKGHPGMANGAPAPTSNGNGNGHGHIRVQIVLNDKSLLGMAEAQVRHMVEATLEDNGSRDLTYCRKGETKAAFSITVSSDAG